MAFGASGVGVGLAVVGRGPWGVGKAQLGLCVGGVPELHVSMCDVNAICTLTHTHTHTHTHANKHYNNA